METTISTHRHLQKKTTIFGIALLAALLLVSLAFPETAQAMPWDDWVNDVGNNISQWVKGFYSYKRQRYLQCLHGYSRVKDIGDNRRTIDSRFRTSDATGQNLSTSRCQRYHAGCQGDSDSCRVLLHRKLSRQPFFRHLHGCI